MQRGVSLTDLTYEYGTDGQLTAIVDQLDPSKSKAISYDALNRLVQVAEGIPVTQGGVPVPVEDYAYDGEGNRTVTHLSTLYSSNDHNQLEEDEDYTYAYDIKGNRVSRTAKAGGEIETYTYDSQNRLVGYSSPTTTANYAYDTLGRRVAKTVDGVTTAFVYDTWATNKSTASEIALSFNGGALDNRWLHSGRVDEPLSYEKYTGDNAPNSGSVYELYTDRMGSISKVVDVATGAVEAEYRYDALGQQTQFAGSLFQFYGYSGRETDPESGLLYYRARTYDPAVGAFLQRDPIGFAAGDLNLYAYVENDPYSFTDPSGLSQVAALRHLSVTNANLALGATGTVFIGLINGPLTQIINGLSNPIVFSKSNDDNGTGSEPSDGGGGQCGPGGDPDPSWWKKFREKLNVIIISTLSYWGDDPSQTGYQRSPNDPFESVQDFDSKRKKWQEELRNRTEDDNDRGDDDGSCP